MSRWFRHYAGMMRDDKLVRVAIKSRQTIERVCWVWGVILESAAEIDDNGRYDVDAAEIAYFLRADEGDIHAIEAALADGGRVADSRVVNWGNRQFSSDRSAARVAAHRERKRAENRICNSEETASGGVGNADVTLQDRHCNSPETETETETEEYNTEDKLQCSQTREPISDAVQNWNEAAAAQGWPTIAKLTDKRRSHVRSRLREHRIEGWRATIERARASPYLGGSDPPSWFTFDWITKPENFLKVSEGNYDRNFRPVAGAAPVAQPVNELAQAAMRRVEQSRMQGVRN